MNQFRKNNRPTLMDQVWNFYSGVKYGLDKTVYLELGSYLYRYSKNVRLGRSVYLKRNSIVGCATRESSIEIGENTTIGFNTIIISSKRITIGEDCMIAPHVYIVDSNHGTALNRPFNQQENVSEDIVIEDNVWIGAHVVVLPGVRITAGAIVGANSTVTRNLTEPGVYVGSPASKIS